MNHLITIGVLLALGAYVYACVYACLLWGPTGLLLLYVPLVYAAVYSLVSVLRS